MADKHYFGNASYLFNGKNPIYQIMHNGNSVYNAVDAAYKSFPGIAPIIAQYPSIVPIIVQYPSIVPIIVQYPSIVPIIVQYGWHNGWGDWVNNAAETYGIQIVNFAKAFSILPEMQWCFKEGKTCWLKGDGASYIDTLNIAYGTEIVNVFMFTDTSKSATVLGARPNGDYTKNAQLISSSSNSGVFYLQLGTTYGYSNLAFNRKYVGEIKNNAIYIDNVKCLSGSLSDNGLNVYLFAENTGNSISSTSLSISKHIVKTNGIVSKFFVPSKYNGKYCMLELVSGDFYENKGTGEFSCNVIDD